MTMIANATFADELTFQHVIIMKALKTAYPNKAVNLDEDSSGDFVFVARHQDTRLQDDFFYSCLALNNTGDSTDKDDYRWTFWNHSTGMYATSELGWDASLEEVISFFKQNHG